MRRPNLASSQFLDVRPVIVFGVSLALVALVLTGISLGEFVQARGKEKAYADALRRMDARRTELIGGVEAVNRRLAAVAWKKLQLETTAMEGVVAQRKLVWSQLLADLERVVPWDVRLLSINPSVDQNGSVVVVLNGVATGREAWLKLLAILFTDRKFSDPLPNAEEAPSATNGLGYRFQLTARYWPEGRP
jgi:Tfp pilus assembly protein PilN